MSHEPPSASAPASESARPHFDFAVVRRLRERAGLTHEALAQACGVPASVIAQLERNESTAELAAIGNIAQAFEMATADLIALAEIPPARRRKADGYEADGFYFHRIRYANHHSFLVEARENAKLSRPEVHGDDVETCWVISGSLRLTIGEQAMTLGPGESVQFNAIQNHTYEALEDTILILHHLKKSNRP